MMGLSLENWGKEGMDGFGESLALGLLWNLLQWLGLPGWHL